MFISDRPVAPSDNAGACCCADGKTFKKPRRPFEKERLDSELKLVGEFGLRNKRELWRVQMALSKIRQVRACPGVGSTGAVLRRREERVR